MKRLADQDGVEEAVPQRDRLRRPEHGGDRREAPGQLGQHAGERLDRDDFQSPTDQGLGQFPGTGGEVEDPTGVRGQRGAHRGRRVAGTEPGVTGRGGLERTRQLTGPAAGRGRVRCRHWNIVSRMTARTADRFAGNVIACAGGTAARHVRRESGQ